MRYTYKNVVFEYHEIDEDECRIVAIVNDKEVDSIYIPSVIKSKEQFEKECENYYYIDLPNEYKMY